ncbi:alpha/beta fold hydrolase [Acidobacteriota bacterium]
MLDEQKWLKSVKGISESEYAKFQNFLQTHSLKNIEFDGKSISYYFCGTGEKTILTFAGGWGPPLMLYDRISGLEGNNRMIVIDISPFDDLDAMCNGINQVLQIEEIHRVVLFGQSMTGIMAQTYLKRNRERVEGIILANTIAPRIERCKKWALVLLQILPISFIRFFAKKKLSQLAKYEQEIPEDVKQSMLFKAVLLKNIMDSYFTKKNTVNTLKVAYAFNEKDGYSEGEFERWNGKTLIISSEDDPGYADVAILMKYLPNPEIFKFPTGFKHVAPQVYRDEFHAEIQRFIDQLED